MMSSSVKRSRVEWELHWQVLDTPDDSRRDKHCDTVLAFFASIVRELEAEQLAQHRQKFFHVDATSFATMETGTTRTLSALKLPNRQAGTWSLSTIRVSSSFKISEKIKLGAWTRHD